MITFQSPIYYGLLNKKSSVNVISFSLTQSDHIKRLLLYLNVLIYPMLISALDAGCGPGRTALELSSVFNHVEAYDYSQGFVDMMIAKAANRGIRNLVAYQGDSHRQKEICQLKTFDLIHGSNLIDRLHSPEKWVLQSKVRIDFCVKWSNILHSGFIL